MLLTIRLTMPTVHCPVVVAVVVRCSLAVEQQAVLALLVCQGAVCTEEEGVAVLGMLVGLLAKGFRAFWSSGESWY